MFPTTRWSDVLRAGHTTSVTAAPALERLCRVYWYPLYAFIRRRGHSAHQAEDLTQAFFAHLFEQDALKGITEGRTKFRSFLLTALTNFLNNDWHKQHALRRGGQHQIVSWDEIAAEDLYSQEPADEVTPEKLFERRTSFVIAHRLSTVRHAHQILVLQHGEIVERGTHDELLGRRGHYAKLYEEFVRH